MRIESPKPWSEMLSEALKKVSPDEFLGLFERYKPIDDKGRYLHWDELRRRVDKYSDPELAWVSIKAARSQISKKIPLKDIADEAFSFCIL